MGEQAFTCDGHGRCSMTALTSRVGVLLFWGKTHSREANGLGQSEACGFCASNVSSLRSKGGSTPWLSWFPSHFIRGIHPFRGEDMV